MASALEGIVVVDCSWGTAGPMATGQMADHGATVIRVEPPGGDPFREASTDYAVFNRGKESAVVDLKRDDGREVLYRLLEGADVFVESWQPGVADRLGAGWETLHARFPALVYCSISGYGQEGTDRDRPGYEALVLARRGIMYEQAGVREPPIFLGVPMASHGAAFLALSGVLTAIYRRGIDGIGRRVDAALFDGALVGNSMWWMAGENAPEPPGGDPRRRLLNGSFRCADGEYLGVHTAAVGGHGRLMNVLGLGDRIAPAKGTVEMAEPLTPEEAELRAAEVPRILATRPRDEWERDILAADVACIPLLRPGEVFDNRQVVHNGMAVEIDDPDLGRVTQVGVAAKLSATPGRVRGPQPRTGEHTNTRLVAAGYSPAEIAALRASGAVG
jgi:crotonobetainyl-CoA:carnitine CoA-transferase CaiB-like acyl-CoA transferase